MRDRLLPTVRRAITEHRLLDAGEGVVVAVSGGADSVALLHCLLRLRPEWSLTLHVAHFDHRLRDGSRREALFVEELAVAWGLPLTVGSWAREGDEGRPLPAAARQARYRFLDEVAGRLGAAKIALAHHLDDQAETVLLHMLRGSGLRGLRGMLPLREGRFIRPLLGVGREEIEGYLKRHRLSCIEDPSNRDVRYLRNRIRWELMPLLRREYNPALPRTLGRMAAAIADDEAVLAEMARQAFDTLASVEEGRVCLNLDALRALTPSLRRRVIERAIWAVAPGAYLTAAHLEAANQLTAADRSASIALPRGRRAWRSGGHLYVGVGTRKAQAPVHAELQVPGDTLVGEWGVRIAAAVLPRAGVDIDRVEADRAILDWQCLVPPLVMRSWRRGDRFRPLGLGGSKKVHDLFVDAKVPREERERIPIVADRQGILWVPGFRIDERGRIGPATKEVLVLGLHREGGAVSPP